MTIGVSALVVTYHTGPRLRECLYALRSDPGIDETIVIDNGNPPLDQAWLDGFVLARDDAHLMRDGGNPGFGAAVNRGAKIARGQNLLVINPDCVLRRGSIAPMLEILSNNPAPCIAGGKIFDISGVEQRGGRRRTLTLPRAIGVSKWTLEGEPEPDGPVAVGAISGAFFMVSKADFERLEGFDETYFLHVEDLDLCRRTKQAGGCVMYVPGAGALHYTSTSDAPSELVRQHKIDSLKYYFRKFSNGPIERTLVNLVLPFLSFGMTLRR